MSVRPTAYASALAALLLCAACSSAGDLTVVNDSSDDVTVLLGDHDADIAGGGAVVVLDYGCTPGDVVVQSATGESSTLSGPICPDQEIRIAASGAVTAGPPSDPTR